jgi:NAD(P)-dependent dehydrogenase (short-subunit alcohol dehydrogenase family)
MENMEKFSLKNKTAVITGAAGLLGTQHAIALLEVGATVVLTDINVSLLEKTCNELMKKFDGSNIIKFEMNVASIESIKWVEESLMRDGRLINILINNAAIDPKVTSQDEIIEKSRLENFSIKTWELELSVGLTGAFLCSQVFGTNMAKSKQGGIILNIASDLSVFSPDQRIYRRSGLPDDLQPVKPITYSVIKSGLVGMTRYLATYWAESGIRSNALSPGGVFKDQPEEFVQKLTNLIPLGRMAAIDEYKSAVQFLCSDASSYLNGQNIVMDGGRSAW